jgi:hypothetical protein
MMRITAGIDLKSARAAGRTPLPLTKRPVTGLQPAGGRLIEQQRRTTVLPRGIRGDGSLASPRPNRDEDL